MINKGLILKTAAVVSAVSVLIITGCQGGNKETAAVNNKSVVKETSIVSEKDREEDIETVVRSNGLKGQDTEDLRNDSEREAASDGSGQEAASKAEPSKDGDSVLTEEDRGTDGGAEDASAADDECSGEEEWGTDTSSVDSYSDMGDSEYTDNTDEQHEPDSTGVEAEEGFTDEYSDSGVDESGQSDSGESAVPEPEVSVQEYEESGESLTYLGQYVATAYCSCPTCTGPYSSGYTASGTLATEGRTIACNTLPFGTQVYIECGEYSGYYIVEDTGWSPYGDAWLDFFFESHDSALAFGLRYADVYIVG